MKNAMRSGLKGNLFLLAILVILVVGLKVAADAGELDTIWDHPLPDCHVLALTGAEDLTLVDDQSHVLISAADRQGLQPGQQNGVYFYDGNVAPTLVYPTEGQPQGISAIATEVGTRVFLVLHKPAQDVVQILDWANDQLSLVKEVPFDGVKTLNGIVAIDAEKFAASQELGMSFRLGQEVEKLLRLPLGKLWLYDGKVLRIARDNIVYPNGLALSPDRKILYLASMLNRSLLVYDYDPTTFSLRSRAEFPLQTAPDNLKWAGDRLLIGAHPQLLHLMAHSFNAVKFPAPAQLIALDGLPEKPRIVELHSTKGGLLSAVTGGVFMKERVIMGTVFAKGVLDCAKVSEGPVVPPSAR